MKIIIDTREQAPLKFKNRYITEVISRKLDIGDYGCQFEDGHIPDIFFERKSIGDLFGTLGKGYERFKREIIRSQESKQTLFIIIEGSLTKIFLGYEHSTLKGISIVYKLYTLWVKHGIQPIFCKDRAEMAEYITQFYIACGKEYVRKRKLELK